MSCLNCRSKKTLKAVRTPGLSPWFENKYLKELKNAIRDQEQYQALFPNRTRWMKQKQNQYDKYVATLSKNKSPASFEYYHMHLEPVQEINENYRANYAKYLYENPESEMSYEEWLNEEINKTYEANRRYREEKRNDDHNEEWFDPLTPQQYLAYKKNEMKADYFGGKTTRTKRSKLRRTRRK